MASNLVPLHIDKNTGRIIAKGGATTGVGLPGYYFEQLVPTSTWIIPHNQGNDKVICQIYNSANELIIPDEITITSINTILVEFAAPQSGAAHIMFFTTV